jgi:general secretion pathway protein I
MPAMGAQQPKKSPHQVRFQRPDRYPNLASLKASHSSRGFTLLEVLIALSVIAIVLVGVYRLYTQNLIMAESQRFYSMAPLLAQNKLAEIEMEGEEGFNSGSGSFGEDYPGFTWEVEIDEATSETLGEFAAALKKIDLTVGYGQNEFVYHVRTYRYVPET